MTPIPDWWTDHRNLARLAAYLVREEGYDAKNLIEFLADPWSRQPEWDAMRRSEPMSPEDFKFRADATARENSAADEAEKEATLAELDAQFAGIQLPKPKY